MIFPVLFGLVKLTKAGFGNAGQPAFPKNSKIFLLKIKFFYMF
jgi:hypothetical protein